MYMICVCKTCSLTDGQSLIICLCWILLSVVADQAVGALHHAGAISVIKSTPDTFEDIEIGIYKSNLLKRFQDLRYDISSWEKF